RGTPGRVRRLPGLGYAPTGGGTFRPAAACPAEDHRMSGPILAPAQAPAPVRWLHIVPPPVDPVPPHPPPLPPGPDLPPPEVEDPPAPDDTDPVREPGRPPPDVLNCAR